mgnify:CR=1 FL=1
MGDLKNKVILIGGNHHNGLGLVFFIVVEVFGLERKWNQTVWRYCWRGRGAWFCPKIEILG